ncbi:MAG TPA: hypothetical protein VK608_07405 [Edaphobacter sp.]|nr:hypothetical protein [Edaphobacter sp.]
MAQSRAILMLDEIGLLRWFVDGPPVLPGLYRSSEDMETAPSSTMGAVYPLLVDSAPPM